MNTAVPVEVQRVDPNRPGRGPGGSPSRAELEADLQRVRMLANWLDAKFNVAGIRFGFDAIVGLIPGVGDTITGVLAMYPIYVAQRHKLGKSLQARMAFNVIVDWIPGLIPILGDAIDVMFKANLKNLRLLEKAVEDRLQGEP